MPAIEHDLSTQRNYFLRLPATRSMVRSRSAPDAHCKHVALVYYALIKMKDGIETKETCTQQLQTFHQAKKHSGSLAKMSSVPFGSSTGTGLADLKILIPVLLPCETATVFRLFSISAVEFSCNGLCHQLYYRKKLRILNILNFFV